MSIDPQGRLTNIRDIPKHAPYLFNDPDLSTDEAKSMLERVTPDQRCMFFHPLSLHIRHNTISFQPKPSLRYLPFSARPLQIHGHLLSYIAR